MTVDQELQLLVTDFRCWEVVADEIGDRATRYQRFENRGFSAPRWDVLRECYRADARQRGTIR